MFHLGRIGLSVTIIGFAFLLLTGTIKKDDDMKSYYNFWQHVSPRSYGGRDKRQELELFFKQSLFEYQRFLNIMFLVMGGGMMLADSQRGCLLSLISIFYYALLYINPFVEDNQES